MTVLFFKEDVIKKNDKYECLKTGTSWSVRDYLKRVTGKFEESMNTSSVFSQNEIDLLVDLYAKYPTDKFTIYDTLTTEAAQGDILVWAKGTKQYNTFVKTVRDIKDTESTILQETDSRTGDHRVIPVYGADYSIATAKIKLKFLEGKNAWTTRAPDYACKLLITDSPFLIFHREHGNMALPAGSYMITSAIDPASSSFSRMTD